MYKVFTIVLSTIGIIGWFGVLATGDPTFGLPATSIGIGYMYGSLLFKLIFD